MDITWTLVAGELEARVFETRQSREDFREVQRWETPAPAAEVRAQAQTAFAQAACRFIEAREREGRFTRLRLAAPPRMLGLLRDNLGEGAQATVSDEIPKDVSSLPPAQIQAFVAGYGRALG